MAKSTTLRYDFEELQPYPGFDIFVHGYAHIEGEWDSSDPDVGLMRWGWSFGVDEIYINGTNVGADSWNVPKDHPLYSLIENQLCGPRFSDHITSELEDTEPDDPDYDRD